MKTEWSYFMQINNTNVTGNRYEVQSMVDPIGQIPMDVARIIFQNLKTELSSMALVCKSWKALADDKVFRKMIQPVQAFGAQEWREYIGVDAGEEPLLPRRAYVDMEKYGGLLTFIREKVKVIENGKEVLLDNLVIIGKLVGNPKKGNKTGYNHNSRQEVIYERRKQEKPHWVWIKKEVIGRHKTYDEQQELVAKEENITAAGAHISGLIDTVISLFMEYVRSGKRIFDWHPASNVNGRCTYVRVNEERGVFRLGLAFSPLGLDVFAHHDRALDYIGVAPSWKSFGHDKSD